MLGFVLGCLFVLALPRREPPAPAPSSPPAEEPQPGPPAPLHMTTIEAVFAVWGKYAVWDQDLTEVALWDPQTRSYSDCYQVLRAGDTYFFHTIPELTRPILTHGLPDDPAMPLVFTETPEQRENWLRENTQHNWDVLRQTLHGGPPQPPPNSK